MKQGVCPCSCHAWIDSFWEAEKRHNLSLDNENYEDLMSFTKEREALARTEALEEAMEVIEGIKGSWQVQSRREEASNRKDVIDEALEFLRFLKNNGRLED